MRSLLTILAFCLISIASLSAHSTLVLSNAVESELALSEAFDAETHSSIVNAEEYNLVPTDGHCALWASAMCEYLNVDVSTPTGLAVWASFYAACVTVPPGNPEQ